MLGLALGLGSSGCDADLLDLVDAVLGGPCLSSGNCGNHGTSTTGANAPSASSGAVSHGTGASTELDDTNIDNTAQGTHNNSTGLAESSPGCTDETSEPPAECEDGETQERTCSYCGTQAQACEGGQWKDVGECTDQAGNYPGELRVDIRAGKFECGSTHRFWTYDEQCRPIDSDLPSIYVSRCAPTDCCGYGSTVPPSCLDPENLPEGASCVGGPPDPSEVGKTWMTRQMWEDFYESVKTQAPPKS